MSNVKTDKYRMENSVIFNENPGKNSAFCVYQTNSIVLRSTFAQKCILYVETNNIKHPYNKDAKMSRFDMFYGLMMRNLSSSIRKPEAISVHKISQHSTERQLDFFFF